MKPYILIVEDEAILYERLHRFLVKEGFEIGPYTPSVEAAKTILEKRHPDVVLLDIDLQGKRSGLDLGKLLKVDYNIPFIYVTQHSDNRTFYQGLSTEHEQFIVKTKPTLNTQEVLRAIETVLARIRKKDSNKEETVTTTGIMGLTNYLDVLRESGLDTITRVPISYMDILYFTVKPFQSKDDPTKIENTRTNYLWFKTITGDIYFLKSSLRQLRQTLPSNFMRINESYIVNLNPDVLDGKINGSRLSILGEILIIKDTYKDDVRKRLNDMYQS